MSEPERRRNMVILGVLGGAFGILCLVLAFTGQLGRFLLVGVQVVPLAILATLAFAGLRNAGLAVLTYIVLALVGMAILFNAFASVFILFVQPGVMSGSIAPGATLDDIFKPGAASTLLWTMLLLFLVTLIAAAMLLRPVRVAVARIIPIDPDNFVHKIALSVLTLLTLSSFVPLIVLGGTPPILELINSGGLDAASGGEDLVSPLDLIFQFVWTIPAVILAAGWPVVRTLPTTLKRLGMVRPSLTQVLFGIGAGVALALVASFVLDPAIHAIWEAMGWQTTDAAAFNELLSSVITPIGAVLVGVTAGVGEEMAVRGLLQPRIGLIFSNLVFTSLHAFQYGIDALLSVFIIGLILGIIRARSNTSTSAIVHGVYDFVLVFWSAMLVGQQ
jgi:uncharacterized protein